MRIKKKFIITVSGLVELYKNTYINISNEPNNNSKKYGDENEENYGDNFVHDLFAMFEFHFLFLVPLLLRPYHDVHCRRRVGQSLNDGNVMERVC